MEFAEEAVALTAEIRKTWSLVRKVHTGGDAQVVTIVGAKSVRAAMALAALEGVPVTAFPADGVTSPGDWYSIDVLTAADDLPAGTTARPRGGTYQIPTMLPDAVTRSGDHIVVIHGIDRVPHLALNGLRAVLDPTHPQVPAAPGPKRVSPETFIVLAADSMPDKHRAVLIGRLGIVLELPGLTS